jgi:hypothetical protein
MKRLALFLSLVLVFSLALAVPVAAKEKKIRGYVTKIISSTEFEIEDYRITKDASLVFEFEKDDDNPAADFNPNDVRVGTELEIRGEYNEQTGELRAKSIKVVLEETKKIKRTALLERAPAIRRTPDGWEGIFFADGQKIQVASTTQVLFKLNRSEKKVAKEKEKKEKKPKGDIEQRLEDFDVRPLESIDQIGPNTFMNYEGARQPDGIILAKKVEFTRNELEQGEAKMWKDLSPKVKDPNFAQFKPGELAIKKVGKFKLVPSAEAQNYIERLGQSLIPAYQRSLPPGDPNKVPFRFFLVQDKSANAFALPNGTIVVFSGMLGILENEAQLAAVMGHEISHSIQEHTRLQQEYHRGKRTAMKVGAFAASAMGYGSVANILNLIESAIRNGYSRGLENQSDRNALGYMIETGYDIREAPKVWKLMAKKFGQQPTNFFYSSHDNHTKRRSYLMSELSANYPDVDYSALHTNEVEYDRIARLVVDITTKKKKK